MLLIFWLVAGLFLAFSLLLVCRVRVRIQIGLDGNPVQYEANAGILRNFLGLMWKGQDSARAVRMRVGPVVLPFHPAKRTGSSRRKSAGRPFLLGSGKKSWAGFLVRAAGHVHWDDLNISGSAGFSDPAWTGMVFGAVSSLGFLAGKVRMDLIPDFETPGLSGSLSMAVSFVPVVIIGEFIKYRMM